MGGNNIKPNKNDHECPAKLKPEVHSLKKLMKALFGDLKNASKSKLENVWAEKELTIQE